MNKSKYIYINADEWINRLQEELESCKNEKRKTYLQIQINSIKCQPMLSKEDILKE